MEEDELVRLREVHALQKARDERLQLHIKEEQRIKTLVEESLDRHLNEACATRVATEGELANGLGIWGNNFQRLGRGLQYQEGRSGTEEDTRKRTEV